MMTEICIDTYLIKRLVMLAKMGAAAIEGGQHTKFYVDNEIHSPITLRDLIFSIAQRVDMAINEEEDRLDAAMREYDGITGRDVEGLVDGILDEMVERCAKPAEAPQTPKSDVPAWVEGFSPYSALRALYGDKTALGSAFIWEHTRQGEAFWLNRNDNGIDDDAQKILWFMLRDYGRHTGKFMGPVHG